jgi:hypothetical protein
MRQGFIPFHVSHQVSVQIGQFITSNSDITRGIENVKYIITKEKTGKFKPQR